MRNNRRDDLETRAQRLIDSALATRSWCDGQISDCLDDKKINRWSRLLERNGLYEIFCGKLRSGPRDLRLFWNCARAVIGDQLGGLLVDRQDYLLEIFDAVHEKPDFWDLGEKNIFRKYALMSIYRALCNIPHELARNIRHVSGICPGGGPDSVREILSPMRAALKESMKSSLRSKELSQFPSAIRENQLSARLVIAHHYEFLALARTADFKLGRKIQLSAPGLLFAQLSKLLTRGTDRATAFEISLLLRVLGGRSLNTNPPTEQSWRLTFSEAIEYVLGKQVEKDGRWIEHEIEIARDDPFRHSFTPLVYLLDLGSEILTIHFERLVVAGESVLERLQSEIDESRAEFADADLSPAQGKELMRKLAIWFSVSTIMADRFKDLLSVSILTKLGAVLPETDIQWEEVPDALGFKVNIRQGVIEKWQNRSPLRPGAILVYGPPGTGKTTLAKVLAKELDKGRWARCPDARWLFLELNPADFARDGMDKIVANAEYLFSQLQKVRRCVVLLDEMEEFLRIRDGNTSKESRLITTAFLPLLQEAVQSREIILVVATNFVGNIDPAVTRRGRFDLILPLGPPDDKSRRELLKSFTGFADFAKRFNGTEEQVAALLSRFMMGYTRPEMEDYFNELDRQWPAGCACSQTVTLWQIRSERVPTALSGRAGCNWRTFEDEANRYARYAVAPLEDVTSYWREPPFPIEKARCPGLPLEELLELLARHDAGAKIAG